MIEKAQSENVHLFPHPMERALLHAALTDSSVLEQSFLPPEAFSRMEYAKMWRALRELQEEGQEIDAFSAAYKAGLPLEIIDEILFCESQTYSWAKSWENFEEEVREAWFRRRGILPAENFLGAVLSGAKVQDAASELFEMLESVILDTPSSPLSLEEALPSLETRLFGSLTGEGRPVRVALSANGSELISIAPGELHLMAASTGIGKSVMALQIARSVEAAGWPVLIYSLEMGAEEWVARYLAQTGHFDPALLRSQRLCEEALVSLEKGADALKGRKFYIQTEMHTKEAILADMRRQHRRLGIRFFVIDYMGLVQMRHEKNTSRWQLLEDFANSLKVIARELKVAVLAIHQLNRSGEMDGNKGLHNWGDSYGMIRPADGAYILVRKRDNGGSSPRAGNKGEWRREKVRNGPSGVIPLVFDERHLSFIEEGYEKDPF